MDSWLPTDSPRYPPCPPALFPACPVVRCFLWPYRPYALPEEKVRPLGVVPSAEEYRARIEARVTPEQRARGAAVAAARWGKGRKTEGED